MSFSRASAKASVKKKPRARFSVSPADAELADLRPDPGRGKEAPPISRRASKGKTVANASFHAPPVASLAHPNFAALLEAWYDRLRLAKDPTSQ